jgi:hypothetical protein
MLQFLLATLISASLASDEPYEPAPRDRLHYTNATFLRVNPLGLVDLYKLGWRRRLFKQDSTLLRDTYSFMGPAVMATPAYTRLGLYAEAQILAILRLFGQIDGVGYYGNFDQILSFPSADVVHSDRTLALMGEQGQNQAGMGWVVTLGGTLRAAVGPVAVRTTPQLTRIDLALPTGAAFFYDQFWDRLAPDGGWMLMQDSDLLVLAGPARVGVRHTQTNGLGEGLATHRVGPLFAWQFFDKAAGEAFNQPTLFVISQWWLQHPYRTGAEQPQGLPLIAAGFAFNGDLRVGD